MVDLAVSGSTHDVYTAPLFAEWAANVVFHWSWAREDTPFRGRCFVVRAPRTAPESNPAEILAALSALADQRAVDLPYYEDSPDESERLLRITKALYASQAESMAHYDD
jgi:hypothetical protein